MHVATGMCGLCGNFSLHGRCVAIDVNLATSGKCILTAARLLDMCVYVKLSMSVYIYILAMCIYINVYIYMPIHN